MAKTGRPNFAYIIEGTWRGETHDFQITGNTSGGALSAADAKTFMEGASSPYALSFAPFQASASVQVIGSRYYNGTSSAPVYEANYAAGGAPAALVPTGTAYTGGGTYALPLEVCCMLEARVGTSTKGKPVFCRKFIRGVPQGAMTSGGGFDFAAEAATAAHACGNGSWFNSIVYVSPTGAAADSSGWSALVEPGNHQVPRGKKRKVAAGSASQSSLLSQLLTAIAGGAAGSTLEKIIAAAG